MWYHNGAFDVTMEHCDIVVDAVLSTWHFEVSMGHCTITRERHSLMMWPCDITNRHCGVPSGHCDNTIGHCRSEARQCYSEHCDVALGITRAIAMRVHDDFTMAPLMWYHKGNCYIKMETVVSHC